MAINKMADCPRPEVVRHGRKWHVVCDERTDKERERDSAQWVMPDSEQCRTMRKTLSKHGYHLYCDEEAK